MSLIYFFPYFASILFSFSCLHISAINTDTYSVLPASTNFFRIQKMRWLGIRLCHADDDELSNSADARRSARPDAWRH